VQHLAAAEREQLARERGRLRGGAGDLRELLAAVAAREDLGVAGDHRQQVVEVVRDAAGEAADRLHLLRVAQPALEPLALADVVGEHERGAAALERDPPGRDLDRRSASRPCASGARSSARASPAAAGLTSRASPGRPRRADVGDRHRQELVAR
jgi:hypothetical protein